MKPTIAALATVTATPALAHSGAHLHPHGSGNWLIVVLAAVTVGGTLAFAHFRGRK